MALFYLKRREMYSLGTTPRSLLRSEPITIAWPARPSIWRPALGWSGLAVEPQREFGADYKRFRRRTKFLPFFVSDTSNRTTRLYAIRNQSSVASSDGEFVRHFGEPDEVRDVTTIVSFRRGCVAM